MLLYINNVFIDTDRWDTMHIKEEDGELRLYFTRLGNDHKQMYFIVSERFINQLKNKAEIVYEKEKV